MSFCIPLVTWICNKLVNVDFVISQSRDSLRLCCLGEVIEESDEEGEEENTEDFEKEQWAKLEAEKQTLLADKDMLSEVIDFEMRLHLFRSMLCYVIIVLHILCSFKNC